jgi:hypothetical protein
MQTTSRLEELATARLKQYPKAFHKAVEAFVTELRAVPLTELMGDKPTYKEVKAVAETYLHNIEVRQRAQTSGVKPDRGGVHASGESQPSLGPSSPSPRPTQIVDLPARQQPKQGGKFIGSVAPVFKAGAKRAAAMASKAILYRLYDGADLGELTFADLRIRLAKMPRDILQQARDYRVMQAIDRICVPSDINARIRDEIKPAELQQAIDGANAELGRKLALLAGEPDTVEVNTLLDDGNGQRLLLTEAQKHPA